MIKRSSDGINFVMKIDWQCSGNSGITDGVIVFKCQMEALGPPPVMIQSPWRLTSPSQDPSLGLDKLANLFGSIVLVCGLESEKNNNNIEMKPSL